MIEKTGIQSEIMLRFTHQQAAERTHIGERNKQEVWAFIPLVMEGILRLGVHFQFTGELEPSSF